MRLTIIGSGRAAWMFATIWSRAERPLARLLCRRPAAAEAFGALGIERRGIEPAALDGAELVLFAVSDGAIEDVYRTIGPAIPPEAAVFHASGSRPSSLFTHPQRFSLHPLRSLPLAGSPVDPTGTLFTWEGVESTRLVAESIVRDAGGEMRVIETADKALYHAAAVIGSNYIAAMLEQAARLMEKAGVDDSDGALARLARSTVDNWESSTGADRFTGPIVRRDIRVVEEHLNALATLPDERDLYVSIARALVRLLRNDPEAPPLHEIEEALGRNRQS